MGREIRMVPKDWEHPRDENGRYKRLYAEDYETARENWYSDCIKGGGRYIGGDGEKTWWHDWAGSPPDLESYRNRTWKPEEATCIQMYETVSEGTPVSPVFERGAEFLNVALTATAQV